MKRRIALGAVVAAVALMGSMDSAKADHCPTYSQSYGYSSGSYYQPSYNYGYSNSYYQPSYNYGYGQSSYCRPSYGHSYSRPGLSINFGSGRSGFSFGSGRSGFGRSSHYGHRH